MGDVCRAEPFKDNRVASRKAEEAALRRFQAAAWLESMVGPLGLSSSQPSEMEFVSCLRNGLVLCNLINKIQPGAVPKVINNQSSRLSFEIQPPPAYQYFENIRNFLVAVEDLKLPAFEASDLERDTLESGSVTKIVDCILALKSFHEWKMYNGAIGPCKFLKSPAISNKFYTHTTSSKSNICRSLNTVTDSKKQGIPHETPNSEDLLIKMLSEQVFDFKENIDHNIMHAVLDGISDPVKEFTEIFSSSLLTQQLKPDQLSTGNAMAEGDCNHCRWCHGKDHCNHWQILKAQVKELGDLKTMLSRAKSDVLSLQCQLQSDLTQLGSQIQGLSVAALGYGKAMKENRDLYNMLQDLKGNIRVYCRVRPSSSTEAKSSIDFIGNDGSLVIMNPLKMKSDSQKVFHFNKVFGATATQGEVYRDTQSLIRSVMDGYNACIFAYGQTGSGKTHTMFGPSDGSSKDAGINYLALNDLFEISCIRNDVIKYEVCIQMVEIYNDQVRDLLAEDTANTKLEIRSCPSNGGLSLPDATIRPVRSPEDVQELMELGECNRVLCSTAINQRSSRSHSVLTVHVHGKEISGGTIHSRLHLVDLAGSERVDKSEVTGDRLKEAQHINKSLSCLGDVITALGQKNPHIPYRNCKLTQLLQDSLGGQAKTLMFAHVSPDADFYEETVSTLRFAQRVSKVELGAAQLNKESNEVRQLKEQVENLKKALAAKQGEKSEYSHKLRGSIPEQMAKHTPPCAAQLSLDKHGMMIEQKDSCLDEKYVEKSPALLSNSVTKITPLRSRRLSLEGLNPGKKQQPLTKFSDIRSSIPHPVSSQTNSVARPLPEVVGVNDQDATASLGSDNRHVVGANNVNEPFHQSSPNPIGSSFPSQIPKLENRSRIMPLQQPKTPELVGRLQEAVTPDENSNLSFKSSQQRFRSNRKGDKGSQIRKSLRTIGKLINGSERRNQQTALEKPSPLPGKRDDSDVNSSTTLSASARKLRRQSLINIPTSGVGASRRSSLGGKSTGDSYSYEAQVAAKSPPSVHPSSKATKRWL